MCAVCVGGCVWVCGCVGVVCGVCGCVLGCVSVWVCGCVCVGVCAVCVCGCVWVCVCVRGCVCELGHRCTDAPAWLTSWAEYLKAACPEICGSVFGRLSAKRGPQTSLERRGHVCLGGLGYQGNKHHHIWLAVCHWYPKPPKQHSLYIYSYLSRRYKTARCRERRADSFSCDRPCSDVCIIEVCNRNGVPTK